ncbi:ABC transporter permease [Fundicoccus culcitae]|uniref:ABC transporter permease n=1 Tax=Fundicoccus culcitae TaxID=2969821 RepID=A0ABY5P227_9LACT|nr:ABC transporter permease [Fundicoccus culcitae]UUX32754.1 ABC transporter permease [Fundicoccus culcitae]
MFSHLLRYTPRLMYRDRQGVLFGILFPFAFGLIYLLVFTGLLSGGTTLDVIPIAMVFNGSAEEVTSIQANLTAIAVEGEKSDGKIVLKDDVEEEPLMAYVVVDDLAAGQQLAQDGVVDATVIADATQDGVSFSLEVAPAAINDFTSSIIYSAFNSYTSITAGYTTAFTNIANSEDPVNSLVQVTNRAEAFQANPELIVNARSESGTTSTSIYFYSAIAYLCIFFMSIGVNMITENEAIHSTQALRATVSPVPKIKRFLATFISWGLPSLAIVYAVIAIYYFNGVPLGYHWGRIIAIVTLGVLVGLLMGTAIAGVFKRHSGVTVAISIGLPLMFGAFTGMMSNALKIFINDNAPWFNKINPVALINDGIFYLNTYPTFKQYNENLLILAIMAVVLFVITIVSLRRTDYASL